MRRSARGVRKTVSARGGWSGSPILQHLATARQQDGENLIIGGADGLFVELVALRFGAIESGIGADQVGMGLLVPMAEQKVEAEALRVELLLGKPPPGHVG